MTDLLQACEFRSIHQQLTKYDLMGNFREEKKSFSCKRVDTHIITCSNDVCGSTGKGYFMHFSTASLRTERLWKLSGFTPNLVPSVSSSSSMGAKRSTTSSTSGFESPTRPSAADEHSSGGSKVDTGPVGSGTKNLVVELGVCFFHREWKRILGASRHHSEHDSQGSHGF